MLWFVPTIAHTARGCNQTSASSAAAAANLVTAAQGVTSDFSRRRRPPPLTTNTTKGKRTSCEPSWILEGLPWLAADPRLLPPCYCCCCSAARLGASHPWRTGLSLTGSGGEGLVVGGTRGGMGRLFCSGCTTTMRHHHVPTLGSPARTRNLRCSRQVPRFVSSQHVT